MSSIGMRAVLGVLITSMLLVLSACSDPATESNKSLQNAKNYLAEHKLRAAAIELKNALQANPDNAEARYLLALNNLKFGDVAGAEKEFRRALKSGWNEEQAIIGLASALVLSNAYQNVIDEIKIKDEYSENTRAELYALRAVAFLGQDKRDLAKAALAEGERLNPDAFHVMKSTIQLDLANDNLTGADNDLKKALAAYPESQELMLLEVLAAIRNQDKTRAKQALQKIIDLDPPHITTIYGRQARLRLVGFEIMDKQFDQAQATLEPLVKLSPKDPQTNYLVGLLAFAQGDYEKSEESLLKVLQVAPENLQSILLFGTVSYQKKNYEQAANYLSRYINAEPGNIGARKLLGRAYMMLGQNEQAKAVLKSGLDTSADDVELLALVGLNQMRTGELGSGIQSLEKAAEFAPDNTAIRKELAVAYMASGETQLAIKELNTLLADSDEADKTKTLLILAHLKAGDKDKAIQVALEILAENPDNPATMTLVGNVFAATGDHKEARNYFNQALAIDPENIQAVFSLARLEEFEGNETKAADLYHKIMKANTQSIVPMIALARLAEKRGNKDEMFEWLEKARATDPKQIQPLTALAEAYLRDKDWSKAEIVIKEAREIDKNNTNVLSQLCRLLIAQQRYNEAFPYLRKLVKAEPESSYARVLLAENYLKLGQKEDARKELEVALKLQPHSIPAMIIMASLLLQSGQFEQAYEYAKRIKEINPDLPIGYELAGDSFFGKADYSEAKSYYEKAYNINQTSELAIKISMSSIRSGVADEGLELLQNWLKDHQDDTKTYQFLGTSLQNLGRKSEAIDTYEKVLALQPDNVVALNNLAGLYSGANEKKALELAEKAYNIDPKNPGIQDTYGWILLRQGQVDTGFRLIKEAHAKLSDVAEVRYHYAMGMIKTGKKTEGNKLLRKLLNEGVEFEGREEAERMINTSD